MSASHVSHRFEVERVRRHIRWSQSTEIVCRADLDSFLIGAKTHRMVHRKMEDARRIPDEATGMNASDCSVGSNLNGSGISRQTFVSLTAEGPDGICFDAHCADDSSADTTIKLAGFDGTDGRMLCLWALLMRTGSRVLVFPWLSFDFAIKGVRR